MPAFANTDAGKLFWTCNSVVDQPQFPQPRLSSVLPSAVINLK